MNAELESKQDEGFWFTLKEKILPHPKRDVLIRLSLRASACIGGYMIS